MGAEKEEISVTVPLRAAHAFLHRFRGVGGVRGPEHLHSLFSCSFGHPIGQWGTGQCSSIDQSNFGLDPPQDRTRQDGQVVTCVPIWRAASWNPVSPAHSQNSPFAKLELLTAHTRPTLDGNVFQFLSFPPLFWLSLSHDRLHVARVDRYAIQNNISQAGPINSRRPTQIVWPWLNFMLGLTWC